MKMFHFFMTVAPPQQRFKPAAEPRKLRLERSRGILFCRREEKGQKLPNTLSLDFPGQFDSMDMSSFAGRQGN
jgi:hypothetical protein